MGTIAPGSTSAHWKESDRQVAAGHREGTSACQSLTCKYRRLFSVITHGLPVSPEALVIPPWCPPFLPLYLPDVNALVPRITSTLGTLINQFVPISGDGEALFPPLAPWSHGSERKAIGLDVPEQKEAALPAFSPLPSRIPCG